MGQTAAALELDIERQRQALTARSERFQRRVRGDVQTVRARTAEHFSGVKQSVSSTGEEALGKVGRVAGTTAGSGTAVASHPKALLAGAAVGGLVAGMASGGDDSDQPSDSALSTNRAKRARQSSPQEGAGLTRTLAALARSFAASQATSLVESFVGSAKRNLKPAMDGDARSPKQHDARGDDHPVHVAPPPQLRGGGQLTGASSESGGLAPGAFNA